MYIGTFPAASNRQSWSYNLEVVDADTDEDINLTGATITFEFRDPRNLLTILSATTTNGKVTLATTGVFSVAFSLSDMQTLYPLTYDVGCTILVNGETMQYIIGTISILDGIVSTT
jgi:hypothetical protein